MSEVAENSVDKRDSILQGAFDEFCENGFLAASMDRISKRAGASKRTVYRYFESKEVLFQTLMLSLKFTVPLQASQNSQRMLRFLRQGLR